MGGASGVVFGCLWARQFWGVLALVKGMEHRRVLKLVSHLFGLVDCALWEALNGFVVFWWVGWCGCRIWEPRGVTLVLV